MSNKDFFIKDEIKAKSIYVDTLRVKWIECDYIKCSKEIYVGKDWSKNGGVHIIDRYVKVFSKGNHENVMYIHCDEINKVEYSKTIKKFK